MGTYSSVIGDVTLSLKISVIVLSRILYDGVRKNSECNILTLKVDTDIIFESIAYKSAQAHSGLKFSEFRGKMQILCSIE